MTGKVYIASMNMRGKWATAPENTLKINVTSAQSKKSKNRRDFSPMTQIIGTYKGYWNFESYWQSGKVFEGVSEDKVKNWWKKLKQPKRRYPGAKNKKVLYATFDKKNKKLDYITSRKQVYVPQYYNLVKNKEMMKYWKKIVSEGTNVVIYDFDGVRKSNGDIMCCELTLELLIDKINDPTHPFGHGYIIGACLCGILPKKYIK